jgi:hypothetical protein
MGQVLVTAGSYVCVDDVSYLIAVVNTLGIRRVTTF